MTAYQVTWFLLIGILFTVYIILDGFDLGLGFWTLFTKDKELRRSILSKIGPVWDGNEVWLVTAGGALFAAFPPVYATAFSQFYLAMMLLLVCLIFRAVAIEFRNQLASGLWQRTWDLVFGLSSTLSTLILGIALGNILIGFPVDADGNLVLGFFALFNPFSIFVGLLGLMLLATHGALFWALTTPAIQSVARRFAIWSGVGSLFVFLLTAATTFFFSDKLLLNFYAYPFLWLIPILAIASMVYSGFSNLRNRHKRAFGFSCLSIVLWMGTVGATLFPRLIPILGDNQSLTLFNASSSELTLKTMLVITIIGLPLVIGYTFWIYRRVWGKNHT